MPAPWRAGSTARLLSSTSPGSGPSIELEVPGDRVVVRCDENAPEADVPVCGCDFESCGELEHRAELGPRTLGTS